MYRCQICRGISKPGRPQRKHAVIKADGNILSELSVCSWCAERLAAGATVKQLVQQHRAATNGIGAGVMSSGSSPLPAQRLR